MVVFPLPEAGAATITAGTVLTGSGRRYHSIPR